MRIPRSSRARIPPYLRVKPSATVGAAGPLDALPAASAAYGLRALRSAYSGPLVRVRRSNDNAETNIGYLATGDLDTTALTTFVGANSAYVTTWYDQSGNARDVTQSTQANQPRIVNAGVVDTLNGKPTIVYSGAQWLVKSGAVSIGGTALTASAVAAMSSGSPNYARVMSLSAGGSDYNNVSSMALGRDGTNQAIVSIRNSVALLPVSITYGALCVMGARFTGSVNTSSVNNGKDGTAVAISGSFGITQIMLGNSVDGGQLTGNITEVIISGALTDVERENIIVNQMYYFNLGNGFLANGLRQKEWRPYSVASPYNQPVKKSAVRVASGIQYTSVSGSESGYPTRLVADKAVIVMRPADPALTVNYSSIGWDGGDRCNTTGAFGGFPQTVRCPTNYLVPNSGENNIGTFLGPSNVLEHNNAFTRCVDSNPATAFRVFPPTNVTGDAIDGSHGGSEIAGLVAIRGKEFTDGLIRHTCLINIHAAKWFKFVTANTSFRAPAKVNDNYANATTYGGTNAALMPGSLLVLPEDFNLGALRTKAGRVIARMFMWHGALCGDDGKWNVWALAMGVGPDEDAEVDFNTAFGFAYAQTSHTVGSETPFMLDMIDIMQATQVVDNNTLAAGWGGGAGAPLVPIVGAIGN